MQNKRDTGREDNSSKVSPKQMTQPNPPMTAAAVPPVFRENKRFLTCGITQGVGGCNMKRGYLSAVQNTHGSSVLNRMPLASRGALPHGESALGAVSGCCCRCYKDPTTLPCLLVHLFRRLLRGKRSLSRYFFGCGRAGPRSRRL